MVGFETIDEEELKRNELREEELAREIVKEKLDVSFSKRKIPLKGTDKKHEFDLVSPDGLIVGEIKSSKSTKYGVRIVGRKMSEACLYLIGAQGAAKRLLVLTDEGYYKSFKESPHAGIAQANGIEIMHIDTGEKSSIQEKERGLPKMDKQIEKTADKYLPGRWKSSPARKRQISGVIREYLDSSTSLETMKRERKARELVAKEEGVDPSTISDKYTRQIYPRDEKDKTDRFRRALEKIEADLK